MVLTRSHRVGAYLAVLAVALAACGGSSDSSSPTGTQPTGSEPAETQAASTEPTAESVTIKVGLTAAFSGPIAYYGQDAERGVQLAIEEIEAAESNYDYELVTSDDECNPAGGASSIGNLIDVEEVDVILGSTCSGATLGGMPLLADSEVPGLTFASTNPTVTNDAGVGGNPFQWRMNIDDSIMGNTFAQYIADHGATTVAILAANNDFGRGAAGVYIELLPEVGVEIVADQYFELGTSDLRAQLTAMDAAGADSVLVFAEPPDCALMARQMNELGMDQQIYSRGGCAIPEGLEQLEDPTIVDGLQEATYWVATPEQEHLLEAYAEKYGEENVPYNAALAYYGMYTLHEAVKAGGRDRETIQEALGEVNWDSAIGPITFDDHNQAHPNMFLLTVENGETVILDVIETSSVER